MQTDMVANHAWSKSQESDTSNYEVDVDEYLKTGEPVEKVEEADNFKQKTGDTSFDIDDIKNRYEFKGEAGRDESCDQCGVAWRDHGINCRGEGSALPEYNEAKEWDDSVTKEQQSDTLDYLLTQKKSMKKKHDAFGTDSTGEADNYPQKASMTSGDWEDDLKNMKDRYQTEVEDVSYGEDIEISTQGKDKTLPDIPALDNVDFGEEAIDYSYYPTKASEAIEKRTYSTYDGIVDEYDRFEASDDEEVTEMVTARKLQGYGSESIAKELTLNYGVSREDALEKVYSIEVSSNDRVANTFFQKMYSECNEAEISELKLYCGSDEE